MSCVDKVFVAYWMQNDFFLILHYIHFIYSASLAIMDTFLYEHYYMLIQVIYSLLVSTVSVL